MANSNPFFRLESKDNRFRPDSPQEENIPLFTERKKPRSFALAVVFTSLKMMVLAFIVVGFIGMGLVLGVVKAYVETTPTLDVAQLTISDYTSYLYDKNGDLISSIADVEYRDWASLDKYARRYRQFCRRRAVTGFWLGSPAICAGVCGGSSSPGAAA